MSYDEVEDSLIEKDDMEQGRFRRYRRRKVKELND
jgi:hypothetical protein